MHYLLSSGQQPTPVMLKRLDELASRKVEGAVERWMPTRLILHNYWLYPYQEFHFADGRLILRGQNGAGKSTVLVTAVTLALDGEKTPGRMDTFGTNSKSIADYLVGPKDAKPDDTGYHTDRTAYIALEFRHGSEKRYRTIGLGIRAERRTASAVPKLSPWYFIVRDGRRVGRGYNVELSRRDGNQELMLSARDLEAALGSGNFFSENQGQYQTEVNQELFGFPDDSGYAYLIQVLLAMRSPKLNKDLKPEDACEILSEALPPLSPGLLNKVTRLLDDIDATQKAVKETEDHLRRVSEIDRAQAGAYRNRAQDRALTLVEALDTRGSTEETLEKTREEATSHARSVEELQGQERALDREHSEIAGSLRILRNHTAYRSQDKLRLAIDEEEKARTELGAAESTVGIHEQARDNADADVGRATNAWRARRDKAQKACTPMRETAEKARWDVAARAAGTLHEALRIVSPEQELPRFDASALRDLGLDRIERLTRVRVALRTVDAAQRKHEAASTTVETRTRDLENADQRRRAASEQLGRARSAAAEAVRLWSTDVRILNVPTERIDHAAEAVAAIADANVDPISALSPVLEYAAKVRESLERTRADTSARIEQMERERHDLKEEIDSWKRNARFNEPAARPGQEALRQKLTAEGISAVPFYATCDLVDGTVPEAAAWIESALEEAGILDVLVVDPASARRIGELIGEEPDARADRWLTPKPVEGPTLRDILQPAPCDLPADLVDAALRSIALGKLNGGASLGPEGRWRIGPIEGRALDPRKAEPEYLGETNRRLAWERRLREMEQDLADLEGRIVSAAAAVERLKSEIRSVGAEEIALRNRTEFNQLRSALHRLKGAEDRVEEARHALGEAESVAEETRVELGERRREMETHVAAIPDVRSALTDDGIGDLISSTRETISGIADISTALEMMATFATQIGEARSRLDNAEKLLQAARTQVERRQAIASERAAELETIRHALTEAGLDDLLKREAELTARAEQMPRLRAEVAEKKGARQAEHQGALGKIAALEETLASQDAGVQQAAEALWRMLRAYPTFADELRLFDTVSSEAAARALLSGRRGDADMRRRIKDDLIRAERELTDALSNHKSALIGYSPDVESSDEGLYVVFRRVPNETGARTPSSFRAVLERDHQLHKTTVREKEDELFEEFVFGEVSHAIRTAIDHADNANKHVNNLLEQRRISDGWQIFLEWEPKGEDRHDDADYAKVVKYLQLSPTVLRPDQQREIKDFFRRQMAQIREDEREGRSEKPFAQALQEVLDYRRWFKYSIWISERGAKAYELTNVRYGKNSGAEKALSVFFPLLAAADARYRDARPNAPKILAMDEAFNGVDEPNKNATWRFMSDLHFSWIMTSEKLWGVGPSLSACCTYQFLKRGGIAAVSLWLWDGTVRVRDDEMSMPQAEPGDLTSLLAPAGRIA